ncbi:TetR/AcrR family transcriptional regulator [Streptomyces sp. NBC_01275]|uniref:TetR/AcrR family transcriptional regulator n=1 Tax=Streptomyces sp. NBC_01275 TaxID=2903807 RepID=UPI0022520EA8|nr:TetR/AcrR family transcriptional regulator [Streptomyces sp. NBC_01275]MCX4763740.1 TetR/AcrR family transcriptional regulator [Streptomyces sp. NBC_01275]
MSAEPGTVRPGGRTARVRAAVLRAAGDVLAEEGFDRLDLTDVARRAEVGKTTVYRRWGSVPGLVADLLSDLSAQSDLSNPSGLSAQSDPSAEASLPRTQSDPSAEASLPRTETSPPETGATLPMAETSLPRAGTGSVLGDLLANGRVVQRTLADARQGPLLRAVIAAAACDARTAEALRRFHEVRVAEWAPRVQQGVTRGELPAGTDAKAVVRAVSAPLYYALLTTGTPPDAPAADRAARAAHAAATAGVYVVQDAPRNQGPSGTPTRPPVPAPPAPRPRTRRTAG